MASQISFYRNSSACQISVIPGKIITKEDGATFFDKDGAVYLEMTSGKNREYNWKDRIKFAISLTDFPAVLAAEKQFLAKGWVNDKKALFELVHDPNAGKDNAKQIVKTLQLTPGTNQDSFFLVLNEKNGGESKRHFVGLSFGELLLFFEVVKSSIPYILAWNKLA